MMDKFNIHIGNMILRSLENRYILAEILFERENPASSTEKLVVIACLEKDAEGFLLHVMTTNLDKGDLRVYSQENFATLIDIMMFIVQKTMIKSGEVLAYTGKDIRLDNTDTKYSFLDDGNID